MFFSACSASDRLAYKSIFIADQCEQKASFNELDLWLSMRAKGITNQEKN